MCAVPVVVPGNISPGRPPLKILLQHEEPGTLRRPWRAPERTPLSGTSQDRSADLLREAPLQRLAWAKGVPFRAWRKATSESKTCRTPASCSSPTEKPPVRTPRVGILSLPAAWASKIESPTMMALAPSTLAQGACISVNDAYKHGTRQAVLRFTLAHELAHLLLDRERGVDLAVSSGDGHRRRSSSGLTLSPLPSSCLRGWCSTPKEVGGEANEYETVRKMDHSAQGERCLPGGSFLQH